MQTNSEIMFTPINQAQIQCITIAVVDDLISEADETVPVLVTTADHAVNLSPSAAVVTIVDNDGGKCL